MKAFGSSAREVLPAMVEAGHGTIQLTGASASLRGKARFSALAVGKFGLRALVQSMAREFGPQGIHVSHVIIDGQIDTPGIRTMMPDREEHTLLSPDAIAETYWQLHAQDRTAWTLGLDLRPSVESFWPYRPPATRPATDEKARPSTVSSRGSSSKFSSTWRKALRMS